MKATLHQLSIRNFKAFPAFDLNLEGRHLLLYGPNDSGKSSLYWALYTFLQSARKSTPDVTRYFDPAHLETLLNIHAEKQIQRVIHNTSGMYGDLQGLIGASLSPIPMLELSPEEKTEQPNRPDEQSNEVPL